ncbi:MAG: hypothetical protein ACRD28_06730 [Acidobacteriaceae bacterium]
MKHAKERTGFDRTLGPKRAIPITEALIEVETANLTRYNGCVLLEIDQTCGAEANEANDQAAKASWQAACIGLLPSFSIVASTASLKHSRNTLHLKLKREVIY